MSFVVVTPKASQKADGSAPSSQILVETEDSDESGGRRGGLGEYGN